MHGKIVLFLLILILFFVVPETVYPRVYRWTDAAGTVHYSDRVVTGADRVSIRPDHSYGRVKKIYDGDTVLMEDGEKIRLLGINTPEVENSRKSGEPGGEEARQWLNKKLNHTKVRIVPDIVKRDKYGRLLAHLFLENGVHVNAALVEQGLATVNLHPPNLLYSNELLAAQCRAKRAKQGLWILADYQPRRIEDLQVEYRGRGWHRFVGRPSSIREGRSYLRLVFNDHFNVHIPRKNLTLFPDLKSYLDREIEVRGWLSRRRDVISILVRHPASLVMLDSADSH